MLLEHSLELYSVPAVIRAAPAQFNVFEQISISQDSYQTATSAARTVPNEYNFYTYLHGCHLDLENCNNSVVPSAKKNRSHLL